MWRQLQRQGPQHKAQRHLRHHKPRRSHQSETSRTARPNLQVVVHNLMCSLLGQRAQTPLHRGQWERSAEAGRVASMGSSAHCLFLIGRDAKFNRRILSRNQRSETRLICWLCGKCLDSSRPCRSLFCCFDKPPTFNTGPQHVCFKQHLRMQCWTAAPLSTGQKE